MYLHLFEYSASDFKVFGPRFGYALHFESVVLVLIYIVSDCWPRLALGEFEFVVEAFDSRDTVNARMARSTFWRVYMTMRLIK